MARDYVFRLTDALLWLYWGFQIVMKGFAQESDDTVFLYGLFVIVPLAVLKIALGRYSFQSSCVTQFTPLSRHSCMSLRSVVNSVPPVRRASTK